MIRPLYKIEMYCRVKREFVVFLHFWGLRKSFAQGAFSAIKCMCRLKAEEHYRLIKY